MKNIFKISLASFLLFVAFCFLPLIPVEAGGIVKISTSSTESFQKAAGFSTSVSAENMIASIIKTILGLLGIIFIILMILSGYQWMTAGGNEDAIKKARGRIVNAIIGLVIVVLAYSITAFVFKNLPGGGSNTSGSNANTSGVDL